MTEEKYLSEVTLYKHYVQEYNDFLKKRKFMEEDDKEYCEKLNDAYIKVLTNVSKKIKNL